VNGMERKGSSDRGEFEGAGGGVMRLVLFEMRRGKSHTDLQVLRGAMAVILIVFMVISVSVTSSYAVLDYYTSKSTYRVVEVGDPISASSGEMFFNMDFLNLGGPLPLSYSLFYRGDGRYCDDDFFFANDPYILKSGGVRVFRFGQDNNMLYFVSSGGEWVIKGSPVIYRLKETGPDD